MKLEILDVDSELSCATTLLSKNPPNIPAAQVHIDDARALLLKLHEGLEIAKLNYNAALGFG
jgi:hypothetical protein